MKGKSILDQLSSDRSGFKDFVKETFFKSTLRTGNLTSAYF